MKNVIQEFKIYKDNNNKEVRRISQILKIKDPVTDVDLIIQDIIVTNLKKVFNGIQIIGEEDEKEIHTHRVDDLKKEYHIRELEPKELKKDKMLNNIKFLNKKNRKYINDKCKQFKYNNINLKVCILHIPLSYIVILALFLVV